MYNTMYGGVQTNQIQAGNNNTINPIHIKIEDQTGIPGGYKLNAPNTTSAQA